MLVVISNIVAIYRKELQGYFASPLAYITTGVFWLLAGYFLVAVLLGPDGIIQQIATRDQLGIVDQPIDAPYEFLKAYLGVMGSLSLFVLPMLSMGLYAEERKRGTLVLLATSPITNWTVATGKLLAVLTFFISMVLPLLGLEAIAVAAADPPMAPVLLLLGHGGLILLAAAVLSLGMFVSSLTDSVILSGILTFALILFLWVIDVVANNVSGPLAEALRHLSILTHYSNIVQGIVDTSSIVMLLSYAVLGVFLTAQSIDALRFQRS